jgi:hypothetical protein
MPAVLRQFKEEIMLYRKNVGLKERWGRLLAGALIVACSLIQIGFTPLGVALAFGGVLTAITGLIGYCPAYSMARRRPAESPR